MSQVKIQGNASGTGIFTVASPNSNTDRTLTLPDTTGTVLNDQSDITAQVKTATNASGSAPIYSCRAWVSFNGTGTVAIRASGNVTSITDNGTGVYSVNFTTAMPDADYSVVGAVGGSTAGDSGLFGLSGSPSVNTGSCKVLCIQPAVNVFDATHMMVAVFR